MCVPRWALSLINVPSDNTARTTSSVVTRVCLQLNDITYVSVSARYCIPQCVRLIAGGGGGGRLGGVHDRLHIYPLCGIFYFPWHRHQIEGTNGFYCLIRKTERFTISNVESQVFTPRIILAQPGRCSHT